MLRRVRLMLEMIRFSHTIFALPFALSSAALAWRVGDGFHWSQLAGILLCMVFARSAGMAFNRLADRDMDATNPRTAGRHLPAGLLGSREVWLFFAACVAGFVGSTFIFLLVHDNPWPVYLALPVLGFILAYSLTKRFTALCHFWLGASLFLAPVAAWIAIRGMPGWSEMRIPLLLGGAVLFWVAGFDILYATQDVDHDRRSGLRSIPAQLGIAGALRLAMVCHLATIGMLLALYFVAQPYLGWVYLSGWIAVAALLAYEHIIVRADDLTRVNQAFFQVNGIISAGLFVVVLVEVMK
jgi:4-hydroxybenzoate polyprenyltransferase